MTLDLKNISPLPEGVVYFLHDLCQDNLVEKLIVFGSRACGDYDKYSDVDLAVVAPHFIRADWVMLRAKAIHETRTVLKISIVNFLLNPPHLQERIYDNGVVIYEQCKKTIR